MTYLTEQNCFQFHTVYFEAAEFEWWRMLSQSPVGGSGMLYFYYISKVLCKVLGHYFFNNLQETFVSHSDWYLLEFPMTHGF